MNFYRFCNKVFNRLFHLKFSFYSSLISPIITFLARCRGIDMGKCKFYGSTIIIRKDGSTITIGDGCRFRSLSDSNLIGINHKCIISTQTSDAKLTIGKNCGFSGTTIGCFSSISIGDNVRCGANTLINDADWHLDDSRTTKPKPIVIEENVWLGYGVVVMKGVTIGANSIIGVNSVVTADIPENSIAVGIPCKVIKKLK
ncbi:acyltransferase [Sphingobacterium phlebotomi]|uniref:Acyltransferase n=1 Tax=Sphingobacterium phlebotomi TaxID=2605433 RepID=A0A5D4H8C8_9SPHI|nr:acyltransferase [Sphingobacterium phlebotomi]TYR36837.1 acyltransferase [Sphingobacterium phlebotomi]